jgi:NADH-quinone oxidoreductase subunit L
LTIAAVNEAATELLPLGGTVATVIALCLLVGATGKSAQLPLFVWLPDAMAGPTPVSALIHAATMVTAGIYLIARSGGLFAAAPSILVLVALVGAATAFFGALVATVQPDIKRTLAYSTISQLGFMFMALGVGGAVAAIFHLVTHAFFKALLFLGAGSVMHGMEHGLHAGASDDPEPAEAHGGRAADSHGASPDRQTNRADVFAGIPAHQDMRRMGGLLRPMRWTAMTFAIGALALAGVFPLAGFWSKDEILYDVFVWEGGPGKVLYWVALTTAAITAYYAGRALFMTFLGEARSDGARHATESPPVMVVPLVVLALATILGGLLVIQSGETSWLAQIERGLHGGHEAGDASKLQLALLASAASLAGLGAAWLRHQRGWLEGTPVPESVGRPVARAFYVDEAYRLLFVRPFIRIAAWLWHVADDKVIDGLVNALARVVPTLGQVLRRTQTGYVRSYALSVLLGAAVIAVYLVLVGRP